VPSCLRVGFEYGRYPDRRFQVAAYRVDAGEHEYFRDAVFNYPTLAETYKVAALDGLERSVTT